MRSALNEKGPMIAAESGSKTMRVSPGVGGSKSVQSTSRTWMRGASSLRETKRSRRTIDCLRRLKQNSTPVNYSSRNQGDQSSRQGAGMEAN